jgi:hypothetical protein
LIFIFMGVPIFCKKYMGGMKGMENIYEF